MGFWHKKCCLICHGLKKRSEPLVDKAYDYKNDAGFLFFNANLCKKHTKEIQEEVDKQYGINRGSE